MRLFKLLVLGTLWSAGQTYISLEIIAMWTIPQALWWYVKKLKEADRARREGTSPCFYWRD